MIYTFRLSKISGASQTFTIGKHIQFDSVELLEVQIDDGDATSSNVAGQSSESPLYLFCSALTHDNVIFNNGKASSITNNGSLFIPLGSVAANLSLMNNKTSFPLIDEAGEFEATDTITFSLFEIDGDGIATNAVPANMAFGSDTSATGTAIDRGINIIVKFNLRKDSHNYNGNVTIPNSI